MKSISKSAAGLVFALACGVASAAPVTNLVTNGSFETGLSGWALGGTDGQGLPPRVIRYAPFADAFGEAVPQNNAFTNSPDVVGGQAVYFVSDNAVNQSLFQSITVATAGMYQIGFSAYAPANGFRNVNDATFAGVIADVTLANYSVKAGLATTWQTFSASTFLAAGAHDVKFVFNSFGVPAADVVIDQVYVIAKPPLEVPEPGSLALLGLGLAGLAAATRRKHKHKQA